MADQQQTHRVLFTLFNIPFTVTHNSWQFIPPKLVIGVMVAVLTLTEEAVIARSLWGIVYGVLLLVVLFLHIMGHIFISKRVLPSMTEARITPILIQTLYANDTDIVPGRVHLIRSLGGPAMTLSLGICALLLWSLIGGHPILFFALANFAILGIVLLPLPTVDGEVIWREIGQLLRGKDAR
jgi:hypothetical protein